MGTAHGHVVRDELLKLQKKGQFPDEPVKKKRRTNSLPDVLPTTDIKEVSLGGVLL